MHQKGARALAEEKKQRKYSTENLKPLKGGKELSPEERERQKQVRIMGAKAKGAKIAQRKTIREIYTAMLGQNMPADVQPEAVQAFAERAGASIDNYTALAIAMLLKAVSGDTRAAEFVRDSAGDKPTDQMQVATGLTEGDRQMIQKWMDMQQKDKNGNK